MAGWDVELHDEVASWFERLCEEDAESADLVEQAIDLLAREGPRLGRPLVDRVKGSRFHNMKELRPASARAQWDPDVVRVRSSPTCDPLGCRR